MQPIIVNCDKCSQTFEIKPKSKKVKDDIKENYFQCPHCKEKYITYYSNNESRSIQTEISRVKKLIEEDKNNQELKGKLKQLESKHQMIVLPLTQKMKA